MLQPYPGEFRRDVVAVAGKHEAALSQIARDVGISEATPYDWWRKAEVDDGVRPGATRAEPEELWVLKRCNRLLAQEILRRAAAFDACRAAPMTYRRVLGTGGARALGR